MIRGRRGMTGYLRYGWIEPVLARDVRVAAAPLAGGLNPALPYGKKPGQQRSHFIDFG